MALKIDANFEGKLICASKNDMRIFTRAYKSLKIGSVMTMKNDGKFEQEVVKCPLVK